MSFDVSCKVTKETANVSNTEVLDMGKLSHARVPLYARVRESLRELALQHFADGDKFFSEPALIQRLGVSQGTIRRALGDLTREGLLVRRVPQGTFVCKPTATKMELVVFMPQYDSSFLMSILEKLSGQCRQQRLSLKVHHTHRGENIQEALLQLHGSTATERILLLGETPRAARELFAALFKRGFRVVNVDTLLDGCGDAYVGVDNHAGIRLALDHLTGLGHRRIVLLVNEPLESGNMQVRVATFEAEVRERGLREARVVICGTQFWDDAGEAAYAKMDAVMAEVPLPTAILATSDIGAWVVLKWLREKAISVPTAVSVMGFDDGPASRFMHPSLTTVAQPIAAIAQRAFDLLNQEPTPRGQHLLPPTLVTRESTGPAPHEPMHPPAPCAGQQAKEVSLEHTMVTMIHSV